MEDVVQQKVSQLDFDIAYWPNAHHIPSDVRDDFYSAYLQSHCDLPTYITETSELPAGDIVRLRTGTNDTAVLLTDMGSSDMLIPVLLNGQSAEVQCWEIRRQSAPSPK